jgi:putative transposase
MEKSRNRKKYYLKIHLIFVVKYRKRLLISDLKDFIINKINEISDKKDFNIENINSDINHIHMLIEYPPHISITSIVRKLKQETTYHIWLNYSNILNQYFYREKTF